MDLDQWEQVKENLLRKNPNNRPLHTWLSPVALVGVNDSSEGKILKLGIPSDMHQFWITHNIMDGLFQEASVVYSGPVKIEFVVNQKSPESSQRAFPLEAVGVQAEAAPDETRVFESSRRRSLNADYTFSSFVVGRNSEFAHEACFRVASMPGEVFNPLFICGPTGMGKTHLLNAVGNHIKESFPHLRVVYLTCERFFNECISALRTKNMDAFRKRYRDNCDVLLIDDIQMFGRGEAVQAEFFHTLDAFYAEKRQIVVASDRMPHEIEGLEERIRTRLEQGLIADIQMPDLETRIAILRFKAEQKNFVLPDEIIQYVARISKRSIRELEGKLNTLQIWYDFNQRPLSLEVVKGVFANHAAGTENISAEDIQKMVADYFDVKISELKSTCRAKPIVTARQVSMFLIKKFLDASLVEIGRLHGGKDHSTVINSLKRIENQRSEIKDLDKDIHVLESRIHNITGL